MSCRFDSCPGVALQGIAARPRSVWPMNLRPVLAALGSAWAGLELYNYISGQNALLDWWDTRRLERLSLWECSEFWQRNRRRSDLIVCLTSIPQRVEHVQGTLKSLLTQSRAPQEIRFHLPRYSRREGREYVAPGWLYECPGVRVVDCQDVGPATKLLPALKDLPPRQPLLVVDDDMLYPAELLDHYHRLALRCPDIAIGTSGWRVPADFTDRPTTLRSNLLREAPAPVKCTRLRKPWPIDILQGYSGYLIRPEFVSPQVHDYSGAPDAAFYVDDVWISAHVRVPKWVYPHQRFPFESAKLATFFKQSSLALINRGGGDHSRRNNTIVIRHLAGSFRPSS